MPVPQVFAQQERSIDLQQCAACLLPRCQAHLGEQRKRIFSEEAEGAVPRPDGATAAMSGGWGCVETEVGPDEALHTRVKEVASEARRARAKASQAAAQERMRVQQAAFLNSETCVPPLTSG